MNQTAAIVILLGPPGSGKGTQASRLARATGLTAFSTGELLRRESDSGSALGLKVRALLSAGLLVDDDLMNQAVAKRLSDEDCRNGCILDGYPRTIQQARFLDQMLSQQALPQPLVFDFVVSPEIVLERLSQRRQCPVCGQIYSAEFDVYGKDLVCNGDGALLVRRGDDNPDTIRERLRIYRGKTTDLIAFYKSRRYFAIDAMQSPDAISAELLSALDPCLVPLALRYSTK